MNVCQWCCRSGKWGWLLLMVALLSGCSGGLQADYSSIGLVPVKGKITLDGEPLVGAVVFFEANDGTYAYATTDANGLYALQYNSEVVGTPPGDKVVRISTTASTGEEEMEEELDDESGRLVKADAQQDRVPAAYNKDSKLKVSVSAERTEYNFDLLGDGTTSGPT